MHMVIADDQQHDTATQAQKHHTTLMNSDTAQHLKHIPQCHTSMDDWVFPYIGISNVLWTKLHRPANLALCQGENIQVKLKEMILILFCFLHVGVMSVMSS